MFLSFTFELPFDDDLSTEFCKSIYEPTEELADGQLSENLYKICDLIGIPRSHPRIQKTQREIERYRVYPKEDPAHKSDD